MIHESDEAAVVLLDHEMAESTRGPWLINHIRLRDINCTLQAISIAHYSEISLQRQMGTRGGYILFKASSLAYGAGGAGSRAASAFYARPPRVVGPSPHVVVYHWSIFALIVFLRPLAPLGAALCW